MLKRFKLFTIVLFIVYSCVEPFSGVHGKYKNLLVVDGQITNEEGACEVKLMYSVSDINEEVIPVDSANVLIYDNNGNIFNFIETSPGKYGCIDEHFKGQIGNTYVLQINTKDGKEYCSAPCLLNVPSIIDHVYYLPDDYWSEFEAVRLKGISIFVDGSVVNKDSNYVRWTYDEDWKFEVPYPSNQIVKDDNTIWFIPEKNVVCWKSDVSRDINIHSFQNQINNKIVAEKLLLIPSGETDKLSIRYSILVKQYTISKEEYEFWDQLKQSTEDIEDIFGKQPFAIKSNIKNIKDEEEPVLGYFTVAGVTSKRIYINREEVEQLGIPIESPYDACSVKPFRLGGSYFSVYTMYQKLVAKGNYSIVTGIYDETGEIILGLMLTGKECADCSKTGKVKPPLYWVEE